MSYVYMKFLETAPHRYDRGMQLVTAGRLRRVDQDIARQLMLGQRVLDVGCGTGRLALMLASKGVSVTGVDLSAPMLEVARQSAQQEGLDHQISFRCLGAVDLDTAFGEASFDAVIGTLVMSELEDDEVSYVLAACRRILRTGGKLLVADEVAPDGALWRAVTWLLRLPWVVLTFALTGSGTRRVRQLAEQIERAGFDIVRRRFYLARTLQLVEAERIQGDA